MSPVGAGSLFHSQRGRTSRMEQGYRGQRFPYGDLLSLKPEQKAVVVPTAGGLGSDSWVGQGIHLPI